MIDKTIDWPFIYELVQDKCAKESERPSMDPVMLIKLLSIQYLYEIKSKRKTYKEIEINVTYR